MTGFTSTVRLTAAGAAVATPARVHSITLIAGIDAATATIRDGGAAGTIRHEIKAAIQESKQHRFEGVVYATDVHVSALTGTSPVLFIEYGASQ